VVGQEQDGKARRRHLQRPADGPLTGKLPPVEPTQWRALEAQADPV
jgi:hypothetical protein